MTLILKAAGVYNILWASWVVLFPEHFFELTSMKIPDQLMIWQGMGMVIGVYGLGYWWAAQNPTVHWPIVAVGFMGKVLGPVGFILNYLSGNVPFSFFYTLITNDFIWWIPFFLILQRAREKGKLKLI